MGLAFHSSPFCPQAPVGAPHPTSATTPGWEEGPLSPAGGGAISPKRETSLVPLSGQWAVGPPACLPASPQFILPLGSLVLVKAWSWVGLGPRGFCSQW